MKSILTYISHDKDFNDEHQIAAKIQIDNSLELGWKRSDILLVTNFEYEWNGVKSLVIGDDNRCTYHVPATKIYVLLYLFRVGLIEDDLYWYHDFDCFQLHPFTDIESELGLSDMGLTHYGRMPRLCSASIFFRKSAWDIFESLKRLIDRKQADEETGMMRLINDDDGNLKERVKRLNITYAFHKANFHHCYNRAYKPIKAIHFHLTPDKYDFFVSGNNILNLPVIPDRLIEIFHEHGFTA